jgi:hypothetical protein
MSCRWPVLVVLAISAYGLLGKFIHPLKAPTTYAAAVAYVAIDVQLMTDGSTHWSMAAFQHATCNYLSKDSRTGPP